MLSVDKLATILIIGLALSWSIQLLLTYFQMRRFYSRINQLKKLGGLVSIGMAGSKWKGRQYAVIVVDQATGKVIRAEKLGGWSVFASLKSIEGLADNNLQDLIDENKADSLPVKGKLLQALRDAARHILEYQTQNDVRISNEKNT